jgi:ring-1,2-phenylacetyl-CoA epoxidase subunit PaaC
MESIRVDLSDRVRFLLRVGDTALILAQRNAEWCGHAPVLEEDLALPNLALDQLGQARALLTHAGSLTGHDEDQLAYLRDEAQFLNPVLVELPHAPDNRKPGDFGFTVLRNALLAQWFLQLYGRLQSSDDAELAAIAAKAVKETRYHWQHSADWVVRLGDGTAESHRRLQAALERIWPYVPELFAGTEFEALQAPWRAAIEALLQAATLKLPKDGQHIHQGHKGVHSEHLGHLLAEMQVLQRAYPGGVW